MPMSGQNKMTDTSNSENPSERNGAPVVPNSEVNSGSTIAPQTGCATCGAAGGSAQSGFNATGSPSYVYAIGRVEARFPNLAAEKEFSQVTGRTDTAGKTDQQTFHTVISTRENRYLARQLCW